MKVLIGYTSTEGQTRKIARYAADHIADAGHSVELMEIGDAQNLDLARFDRVILAASLHIGHYQRRFSEFVASRTVELNAARTLLLSVSLAAAGHEAEDWRALDKILADLEAATGWHPGRIDQIAGAYRPSQYDIFRKFVMRRILAMKDPDADPDADREYTDWAALDASIDAWLAST